MLLKIVLSLDQSCHDREPFFEHSSNYYSAVEFSIARRQTTVRSDSNRASQLKVHRIIQLFRLWLLELLLKGLEE
jgi:hypothetical protein